MTLDLYQGWTNRETWLVALWLNNEQVLQEDAQAICRGDGPAEAYEMEEERAQSLADYVDNLIDDQLAQGRAGFIADMISDYLEMVNWRQIVNSFQEDAS